jgi:hypothetical protein
MFSIFCSSLYFICILFNLLYLINYFRFKFEIEIIVISQSELKRKTRRAPNLIEIRENQNDDIPKSNHKISPPVCGHYCTVYKLV